MVLPYDDGRLAFAAILPNSPDLSGWLDSLDGNALSRLVQGAEEQRFFCLALPKFETEWSGSLQKILKDMGLEDAFTPGQADFSRMGDHPNGYYLSEVLHAAKLQVNEKGTEAAAATLVAPGSGAPHRSRASSCCWTAPSCTASLTGRTASPCFWEPLNE